MDSKLHETVYTVNYQDVLILVLNSTDFLEEQTDYIKEKLSNSNAKWKIVTCHHSIFSPAEGRDFEFARINWKPLFDKYGVDLVLNGHDHTYARGHVPLKNTDNNKTSDNQSNDLQFPRQTGTANVLQNYITNDNTNLIICFSQCSNYCLYTNRTFIHYDWRRSKLQQRFITLLYL